jgi:hypothetical protein
MLLEILEPIRQIVTQPSRLFVPASILPRIPLATGWEPAQCTGKDPCLTLASICRIGSRKIAGVARFDVDDWALPYLDKPQPSVKIRGPMPEKVVFA